MKLVFEDKKRMNEGVIIKLPTGELIRMTDKQSDWADRIIYYLDLGDDEDDMTEVQKDFAEGKASKYLDKLDGKAPRRTIDAFKSFLDHESKKRMNEGNFSDFMKNKQDSNYLADTEALMNSIQSYVDTYDSEIYAEQNLRKAIEDLKSTLRTFSK